MRVLSPSGQQAIHNVAQRHGFSFDAVTSMLDAVVNGNGTMAQFSHPEFSGSGQWMAGGMTMVSDMFNNHLKGRVDSLCSELSALYAHQSGLYAPAPMGPSNQSGQALFVPAGPDWWGTDLRWPNSTGSQNGTRYAHFAQARRLAIEVNGRVTVYDTLDHQLGGFSQQQSGLGTMCFNSQYGVVDVGSLPVVSVDGVAPDFNPAPSLMPAATPAQAWAVQNPPLAQSTEADVFATLERLADLTRKGVLTDAEYQSKKAELLSRL